MQPGPQKPSLIVIVGPTASGKSALAVRLAKKFNGEIISADSRQIYRGLKIGAGAVPGKWINGAFVYNGIRHHFIDVLNPRKAFSAAEYKKRANAVIEYIAKRRRLPILVGGTGFWIDAVACNLDFPAVKPDPELRRALARKTPRELLETLQGLDPRRAKEIEEKNPRRLIRAIEIAAALGRVPRLKKRPAYPALWLGLNPHRSVLERNIVRRAKQMVKRGLVSEARKLRRTGLPKKRIRELGFEYQLALAAGEKKLARKELAAALAAKTLAFAKRQMTWFKRNRDIRWIRNARAARNITESFLQTSAERNRPETKARN